MAASDRNIDDVGHREEDRREDEWMLVVLVGQCIAVEEESREMTVSVDTPEWALILVIIGCS